MRTKTQVRRTPPIEVPVITSDFIDESFERITGAPLIAGNDVQILVDAAENYPAWLEAIRGARDRIFFESYIVHDDEQGDLFADALIAKAKEGVHVKLIYDWMGGFGKTSRRFWNRLIQNGVDVRCYNPPKWADPLAVFSRDHRKSLAIDGRVAFISGLCVGKDWVGEPAAGIPPWRDTGIQLTGPAVSDVEAAFADVWATMGPKLDVGPLVKRSELPAQGTVSVRVIQSAPAGAHIYRLDQLLAAAARESMWFTDAYFIGIPSYLQSLKDASLDGVDVRILVPQSTDIALIQDTTRSTYRPLLESGVRVFEWNGSMMHAKTAVFDGRFARVGSSNLNVASWFGNYELDLFVEDAAFGSRMQEMFLKDLENTTEIVLADTARRHRRKREKVIRRGRRTGGSVRKATAGALNAATSISSAIAKTSMLGPAEAKLLFIVGIALLGFAMFLIFFPRIASIPVVVILLILAIPTLVKAIRNYRNH